jgi:hypothetical protein
VREVRMKHLADVQTETEDLLDDSMKAKYGLKNLRIFCLIKGAGLH